MGKDYILLMGSGCLVVLAVGQLFVPRRTEVNVQLCLLMTVCFVWIVHAIGFRLGMLGVYPHLNKLHVPFLAATGPLWYLYVRLLVTHKGWTSKDKKHLVPVILCTVLATPFFLKTVTFKQLYIEVNVSDFVTLTIYLATRIAEIATIIYPLFAIVLIRESRKQKKSCQQSHSILIGLTIVAVVAAVARLIGSVVGNHTVSVFVPVTIILVAFITFCWLGHRYPHLMGFDLRTPRVKVEPTADNRILESYREQIRENLWHLNPDLKIQQLARRFGIPAHDLSEFINRESGGNFKNFLNALRIEHSKELLLDGKNKTMAEIAHASGFNSVSVYYEQFKRLESMPPAKFRSHSSDSSDSLTVQSIASTENKGPNDAETLS